MAAPRLNTVFDYTSLRLQKSGERLVRVKQNSSNLDLPTSRSTIQDGRGNWIARDAAGFQSVYKSKRISQENENDEENENIDLNLGLEAENVDEGDDDRSRRRNGKARAKDGGGIEPPARKRRKIVQDLDFLEVSQDNIDSPSTLPLPSSDLLKCIHHFASNYYNERGQLLNSTRDYRKNRKALQLAKLNNKNHDEARGEVEKGGEEGCGEEDDDEEEDSPPRRKRADYSREKYMLRDMYKIMDGSSLMAIGMLLQEHVAHLLTPKIPEGWEEAMMDAQEDEEVADQGEEQSGSSGDDSVDQNDVPPSTDASQFGAESIEDSESGQEAQVEESDDEDNGMADLLY